jgi:hypothetical protein
MSEANLGHVVQGLKLVNCRRRVLQGRVDFSDMDFVEFTELCVKTKLPVTFGQTVIDRVMHDGFCVVTDHVRFLGL